MRVFNVNLNRDEAAAMNVIEQLKKHWIYSLIGLIIVNTGIVWTVARYLYIEPRNYTIEQQKALISELKDKVNALRQGEEFESTSQQYSNNQAEILSKSTISEDAPILIFNQQVMLRTWAIAYSDYYKSACFSIEIFGQPPIRWEHLIPGQRKTFKYKNNTYIFTLFDTTHSGAVISIVKKE